MAHPRSVVLFKLLQRLRSSPALVSIPAMTTLTILIQLDENVEEGPLVSLNGSPPMVSPALRRCGHRRPLLHLRFLLAQSPCTAAKRWPYTTCVSHEQGQGHQYTVAVAPAKVHPMLHYQAIPMTTGLPTAFWQDHFAEAALSEDINTSCAVWLDTFTPFKQTIDFLELAANLCNHVFSSTTDGLHGHGRDHEGKG